MGKDLKIKHSVSSPPFKIWENFFHRKALHEGANFFGQIFQGMLYKGTDDQIMQRGKLMVQKFIRLSQDSFSSHWPWPGLLLYYLKSYTTNRALNLKNTIRTLCLWGWGFHVKSVFFFKKIIVVTYSLMSWL